MRFVGASVLVVYEGDETRLAEALERHGTDSSLSPRRHEPKSASVYAEEEDELSSSSDDDEGVPDPDGTRYHARKAMNCPPLSLRLIDFAHTRTADGQGPDEGVLQGLGTLAGLVRGRREEVREWLARSTRGEGKGKKEGHSRVKAEHSRGTKERSRVKEKHSRVKDEL